MFVSEYFGLNDELDKKEIFDCILDKDSFFIWNLQKGVVVIPGSSNPDHI